MCISIDGFITTWDETACVSIIYILVFERFIKILVKFNLGNYVKLNLLIYN